MECSTAGRPARYDTDLADAQAAVAEAEAAAAGADASVAVAQASNPPMPGDLRFILDETAVFAGRYVRATPAQIDAMTLFAAATNAVGQFPAFGELLFAATTEQAGKTTGMEVTAALCANPVSAKGTMAALQSTIAAAGNEPEKPRLVLKYDEIGGLYGESGLNRGGNWVLDDVLRDGYKLGASRKWSVNRSSQEFSIHVPVIMTGRGTCLPRDIRSRTIVITLEPGKPKAYFDLREGLPEARDLAACIRQAVTSRLADIAAFRARGIHPQLDGRKLEVWEPLFAVAWILGGQEWLNRCLAAFSELAIAGTDQVALTPRQKTIRELAGIAAVSGRMCVLGDGTEFMGGLSLRDELRAVDELRDAKERRYQGRTAAGLSQVIADALPMSTIQVTVPGGGRVRGYYVADILAEWDRVRPEDPDDVEIPEETDPFEVDG
jgi:hypothetical protein